MQNIIKFARTISEQVEIIIILFRSVETMDLNNQNNKDI